IAFENIAYLVAFIAVNLAVMNLLPIPALDGGRIFFLIINTIAEKIFKKKIDPKYEGYIHAAGMVLLLGLMAFVLVNDVIKIVR
ncbi:MAG: site-2 protease family protein, partial [Oscillospiraceae bacterium]|nr:site-2 protease family protein [Oscillospiraceae bacterium]